MANDAMAPLAQVIHTTMASPPALYVLPEPPKTIPVALAGDQAAPAMERAALDFCSRKLDFLVRVDRVLQLAPFGKLVELRRYVGKILVDFDEVPLNRLVNR